MHPFLSNDQLFSYWNNSLGNKSHFDWLVIAEDRSTRSAWLTLGFFSFCPQLGHAYTHPHTPTPTHTCTPRQLGPWTSRDNWCLIERISKHELLIVPMQINMRQLIEMRKVKMVLENERIETSKCARLVHWIKS